MVALDFEETAALPHTRHRNLDRVLADPDVRCDGICYDGAFRGAHINHAMKAGGLTRIASTTTTCRQTLGPTEQRAPAGIH